MAIIRSFGAYRPRTDIVDRVAALPYDVYNREEAYEEVKQIGRASCRERV